MIATLPEVNTPLLSEALRYLSRGWSIIPIGADKKPTAKWKDFGSERASESAVRKWFAKPGVTGIGVIFGAVSGGLASRDFDSEDAYHRWAQDHAKLAMVLPTVKTSRGFHVYFRAEDERFEDCGDGEYRGDKGHYSVLPPSIHPSGVLYEWTIKPPMGDLPLINPVDEGLASEDCNRAYGANGADRETASVCSVYSVCSVAWSDDLIETLPSGFGQRNHCIWRLARALKARVDIADAPSAHLEPILKEWHRRALPNIRTKEYIESRIDFNDAWNKVDFPLGTDPVEELLKRADMMNPPLSVVNYDKEDARRLATLCTLLQESAGAGVFYLSSRKAASVLGVSDHVAVWRWLKLMKLDGFLVEVEKGTKTRAARYRWIGGPARAK